MENGKATHTPHTPKAPPPVSQKTAPGVLDLPTDLMSMLEASVRAGRPKGFAGSLVRDGRLKVWDTGPRRSKYVSLAEVRAADTTSRRLSKRGKRKQKRSAEPAATVSRGAPILIETNDHHRIDKWCEWMAEGGYKTLTITADSWALDTGSVVVTRSLAKRG